MDFTNIVNSWADQIVSFSSLFGSVKAYKKRKCSLPVNVHRSRTSLLKLPIVFYDKKSASWLILFCFVLFLMKLPILL